MNFFYVKKYFFFIILSLIIIGFLFPQIDNTIIENAKKTLEELVDNKENLTKQQIDYFGRSSEGGEINAYYKDNQLKYYSLHLYSERGRSEFYFMPLCDYLYITEVQYYYEKSIYESEPIGNVKIIQKIEKKYFMINETWTLPRLVDTIKRLALS
jgi:hypothetical protein